MVRSLTLVALLLVTCGSVQAGVLRDDKRDTDWEILFSPYLWGSSLKGESQVGVLPPLEIDASFSDIVSNLNIALALHTEFHRGKFAFVVDPMFVSLEAEADANGPATPIADIEMWLVDAWVAYKITPEWELLGGARFQQQDISVQAGLPSPPFPEDQSFGVKEDWMDWFVGARFNYGIGDGWRIIGHGDIALAGDSETNYQLSLFFNRKIRKTMMLNLGYKFMESDYDGFPSYRWDVRQQGPVVGYTWSF
ncbi:MAG: hypothetical protein AAGE43_14475 [Pseudomonadota bacterium]